MEIERGLGMLGWGVCIDLVFRICIDYYVLDFVIGELLVSRNGKVYFWGVDIYVGNLNISIIYFINKCEIVIELGVGGRGVWVFDGL